MKKILILLFFVSNFIFSQGIITKNLGDFNEIKVYRGLTVELIKSRNPKIIIEGDKSKEVIVKNVNGVLKISLSVLETFSADEVKVFLHYSDDINVIEANEGSLIKSDDKFKQEKIEIISEEAAKVKLTLKTTYVDVKVNTGAQIILEGSSKNQDIAGYTGGIYNGDDLKTEYTNVTSSTGAVVTVNASKLVDANAKLGGTINVNGDPNELKKKESLGGYIKD
ncbi:MAG: head GIN domain-containing protein [Bacteroidota bacterium]